MADDNLTIERVFYDEDSAPALYRLSNGEIINTDEAVNYVRQGKLQGVVVVTEKSGRQYIKPCSTENIK